MHRARGRKGRDPWALLNGLGRLFRCGDGDLRTARELDRQRAVQARLLMDCAYWPHWLPPPLPPSSSAFSKACSPTDPAPQVMVSDIDAAAGATAVSELKKHGISAAFFPCDVSSQAQVEAMVNATVDQLGGLDIVVANAGDGRARLHML